MNSTPVLDDSPPNESKIHGATPHGISVGAGVLWIIAIAAAWNVLIVLFHYLTARLLS